MTAKEKREELALFSSPSSAALYYDKDGLFPTSAWGVLDYEFYEHSPGCMCGLQYLEYLERAYGWSDIVSYAGLRGIDIQDGNIDLAGIARKLLEGGYIKCWWKLFVTPEDEEVQFFYKESDIDKLTDEMLENLLLDYSNITYDNATVNDREN